MKKMIVVVVAVLGMTCFADCGAKVGEVLSEVETISVFFKDFVKAFNSNNAVRVRKMAGRTSDDFMLRIGGKRKFADIEVLGICSEGNYMKVTTKSTIVGDVMRCRFRSAG